VKEYKLSPSDFAFLWEECKRCFYLKVVRGFARPRMAFPQIFNAIDSAMTARYNAADIEVLQGLEPVKRRPGMYTDTTRPNHLVQEVVDNSVDEALSGYAKVIEVRVWNDGSIEVIDDGRDLLR